MAPQLHNQPERVGNLSGHKPGNYTTVQTHLDIRESLINYPISQQRHVYLCGSSEMFQTCHNTITKPEIPTD